jgi:hypothetical protein
MDTSLREHIRCDRPKWNRSSVNSPPRARQRPLGRLDGLPAAQATETVLRLSDHVGALIARVKTAHLDELIPMPAMLKRVLSEVAASAEAAPASVVNQRHQCRYAQLSACCTAVMIVPRVSPGG